MSPRTSAESKMLEAVQSKATAMIYGMKKLGREKEKTRADVAGAETREGGYD